jgi:hypothetical protein
MTNPLFIGCLLDFAAVSAAVLQQAGYDEVSVISQKLCIPLILGGTLAGFLAIYCMVHTLGWAVGLSVWLGLGLALGGIASKVRAWDGLLSVTGLAALLVGASLFWIKFI